MYILKKYFFPASFTLKWWMKLAASFIPSAIIMIIRPLTLDFHQSSVMAGIALAIIWWSSAIVKKIPASLFLLLCFSLFSHVPVQIIFAFPLGETFLMLIVTYLFSQAISNSGLVEKFIRPVLVRYADSPFKCLLAVILSFFITMYLIPQPMARLIIVAVMFDNFLQSTDVPERTRSVLLYSVFVFYAIVNMTSKDADMIMNYVACDFSGVEITNLDWIRAMCIPTFFYGLSILALFCFLFRKDLLQIQLKLSNEVKNEREKFSAKESASIAVIAGTVVLWMTSSIWGDGIKLFGYVGVNTLITIIATIILFFIGTLKIRDLKAVDVTTLIFLSGAFAIGGVMKACGAADTVFGLFQNIFSGGFTISYLLKMIFAGMILHMILGSNTTTLSVIVPGLCMITAGAVSPQLVVYIAIISVAFHAILPFHSVSIMVGASNNYFPNSYVAKLGIPVTPIVYLSAFCFYLPYWMLMGYL